MLARELDAEAFAAAIRARVAGSAATGTAGEADTDNGRRLRARDASQQNFLGLKRYLRRREGEDETTSA